MQKDPDVIEGQNEKLGEDVQRLLYALHDLMAAHNQAMEIISIQSEENERLKSEIEILEKAALQDGLTGLFNQAHFTSELDAINLGDETTERRHTQGNALIMIDMDDFKPINDTHGHAAGDEALKTVAKYLKSQMRETDIVARMGGDEFAILMKGATHDHAEKKLEEIKSGFNGLSFDWKGQRIDLRASVASAYIAPQEDSRAALELADERMYVTKRAKGNTRMALNF